MDNTQILQQFQQQISNKFKDTYTGKDSHKTQTYQSLSDNSFYIKYTPNHKASVNDNDGYVNQIKPLMFLGKIQNQHIVSLSNSQVISLQHFTKDKQFLLINNQVITHKGIKDLRTQLKSKYQVQLMNDGSLKTQKNNSAINLFLNILGATQFVINNGTDYTTSSNAKQSELSELIKSKQTVKDAINDYKHQKALHRGHHKIQKKTGPKAHGKVVAGFSSTAGTPREIRYAKERKKREQQKKHSKRTTKHSQTKKNVIKNKTVITVGRFSIPHKKIVDKIKRLGGKYSANLTNKVNLMICNKASKSKKYKNAKAKGIPIISESEMNR